MSENVSRRRRGGKAEGRAGPRVAHPAPVVTVVGRTQWDVVSGAFVALKRPTVAIPVSLVATGITLMVILGYVRFSYSEKGVVYDIGRPCAEPASRSTADLIARGRELKRPYVLDSVSANVRVQDVETGAGRERHIIWRITYTVRALRSITKSDKVFKEKYHVVGADVTTRWRGSADEVNSSDDGYYVLLDLEEGQTRLVTTGATNVFRLPQRPDRRVLGESLLLSPREQFVSYENDEDVIGDLSIVVEAEHPNFAPVGEAAKRSRWWADASAVSGEGHLFWLVDGQRSLAAQWKNVMPHEEVGLHFRAE